MANQKEKYSQEGSELLTDDELVALGDVARGLTSDERLRIGHFWYQVRVQFVALISFFYACTLMWFTPHVIQRMQLSADMVEMYQGYFYFRSLFLLTTAIVYCISWIKDWHVLGLHMAMLLTGVLTFLLDIVLVYSQFSIQSTLIFTASVMLRVFALLVVAGNIGAKAKMTPKIHRRILGFSWAALLRP